MFGCVTMLLVCVFGFLPKCASNGVIFVVVLGMSFMFSIFADNLLAIVYFDQLVSTFSAASLLFIVCINLSTIPVTLWSPVGACFRLMLLSLQNILKFFALKACAWSHLIDLGMLWNFM